MRKLFLLLILILHFSFLGKTQTPLTVAPDFWVKTIDGEVLELYPILDQNKIVVLDFFSVSCGPCQFYAYDFQLAYEAFGSNLGNAFFLAINYNGTVSDVRFFDSLFNITLPSVSGLDGGGNTVFHQFQMAAYPSVIVIKPDRSISSQYIWPPTSENIQEAVILAGGLLVGLDAPATEKTQFSISPNPSSGKAQIKYTAEKTDHVSLSIYDLKGRLIQLENKLYPVFAGENNINIDLQMLENGIYIVELTGEMHQKLRSKLVRN